MSTIMQSGPTTTKPSSSNQSPKAVTPPRALTTPSPTSPFQMIKNELSGRDVFGILGVILKSALAALMQAAGIATLLTMGWAINDTVLGRIIVPGFFNAFMGILANLLPAALAPHVTLICVGSMVAIFAFPIVSELLEKLFEEEKAKPRRNTVEGHSLIDTIYFVGAWLIPTLWFCMRISQGMGIYDNLYGTVALSALVGGGVGLVKNGQEYVNSLMMRISKRMMAPPVASLNQSAAITPPTTPIADKGVAPVASTTSTPQKNMLPQYQATRRASSVTSASKAKDDAKATVPKKPADKQSAVESANSADKAQVRRSPRPNKSKKTTTM